MTNLKLTYLGFSPPMSIVTSSRHTTGSFLSKSAHTGTMLLRAAFPRGSLLVFTLKIFWHLYGEMKLRTTIHFPCPDPPQARSVWWKPSRTSKNYYWLRWTTGWEQGRVLNLVEDHEIRTFPRGHFICVKTDKHQFCSFWTPWSLMVNSALFYDNWQRQRQHLLPWWSLDQKTGCPILQILQEKKYLMP